MSKKILVLIFSLFFIGNVYADRVAVIGGGSAGLLTAWMVEQNHMVTVFEAQSRAGGHANTVSLNLNGNNVNVESGIDFFNDLSYPYFAKLLNMFNIPVRHFTLMLNAYRTDQDLHITLPPIHNGKVEWHSLSPHKWHTLYQFRKVVERGKELVRRNDESSTLAEAIADLGLHNDFKENVLFPLLAAGWGVHPNEIQDFLALNLLKYLVDTSTFGFKWFEIENGTRTYIDAVAKSLRHSEIRYNQRVTQIIHKGDHYTVVTADGEYSDFEQIVFACDPKTTGALLSSIGEPSPLIDATAKMKTMHVKIAIHGDTRFMPPNRKDWQVANIRYNGFNSALTIYKSWLSQSSPVFKTWINLDVRSPKDMGDAMPSPLYAIHEYQHNYIDRAYHEAQKVVAAEQGKRNLWYAGAWTYGRDGHESGVISAMRVAYYLAPNSDRYRALAYN